MSDVAQRIASLSPEKLALLVQKLSQGASDGDQGEATIVRRPFPDLPCALSFGQERLWFLDQLYPESPLYNVHSALRFKGLLRIELLDAALAAVVARHEMLRTVFPLRDGQPVQQVLPPPSWGLAVVDLAGLGPDRRSAEVERLAITSALQPFDLARGPLLRGSVLRLAAEDHVVLFVAHHIVCDGWSMGVLVHEIKALYGARIGGPAPDLPPLPLQYADYALWQRARLQGDLLESELAFWRERLAGAAERLELPTDFPRPAVQSGRGAIQRVTLSRPLTAALHQVARREGVSLFNATLALFIVLLARYTGQDDLVVGAPSAGRNQPETHDLIGFFVNTMVIRAEIQPAATWRDLLAQLRVTILDAQAHQELPFEMLIDELRPARTLSYSPLVQAVFMLEQTPDDDVQLPGLVSGPVEGESAVAKFDLLFSLLETAAGLEGEITYAADLFAATTIARMARHFSALAGSAVADPDGAALTCSLLTHPERHQLLVEWGGEGEAPAPGGDIVSLYEAQAASRPDRVAVELAGQVLSYGELDRRSEALAQRLRGLGVGPEAPVGLFVDRSLHLAAGMLAILKAGGAYVPLDPSYPAERLAFMLADAAISVLLVDRELPPGLAPAGARLLHLEEGVRAAPQGGEALQHSAPGQVAYLMYTSGSTGRPKGVAVPHRAVVRLVAGADFAALGENQVFLQLAPISFDAATLEIWGPLLNGGRMVLMPPGPATLGEIGAVLRRSGVTLLWLTAGLFQAMVDERLEDLAGVRQLVAGGDVLPVPQVRRVLAELPACRLINGYGPTENTTFTCCETVAWERSEPAVPIGRAIHGTQTFVLDRRLAPQPLGLSGELLASGRGLARGYHRRPDLTAERFLPHPLSPEPGARVYRTGDLVRYRPDGRLEFLRRLDQQVKIRGFRIEPAEVEAVLARHPKVQAAAVVVMKDGRGDRYLAAYCVARPGEVTSGAELGEFLAGILPTYMVPRSIFLLAALPLTANGKVDRGALSTLDGPEAGLEQHLTPPRNAFEEEVAGLYSALLGVHRIGAHSNFFELGGHSLLATRLVSRLRELFGVEISLQDFFSEPTVAGVAARVQTAMQGGTRAQAPPIRRVPRDGFLPMSFAQQRLYLVNQRAPGSTIYNISEAIELHGELDVRALAATLDEIVRRHESLRTSFAVRGGRPIQIPAATVAALLPVVDLSALTAARRQPVAEELAAAAADVEFDLGKGPLLCARLVALDGQTHLLLFTMHHIISDGWSMGVLLREVVALYGAYSASLPSPLPELPIQYIDFACWQHQYLSGEVLDAHLAYWRRELDGADPALPLVTDRPRPRVLGSHAVSSQRVIPEPVSRRLQQQSVDRAATLFMTLLAAFKALLLRYTRRTDLLVCSPIANRNRAELEELIGFFVNMLALRSRLDPDADFAAALSQVRQAALGAYLHQDLPFERIVEELGFDRERGREAQFQVVCALQNLPEGELTMAGLRLTSLASQHETAKFDVLLTFYEAPEGLVADLRCRSDLFDVATADRMLAHLERLLTSVAEAPDRRLSDLPLLSDEEIRELVALSGVAVPFPDGDSFPSLFFAQAARTPEATALVYGDEELAYGELARRARQLASRLRRMGAGPGVMVGICLKRSLDLVVAILGTLAAGAAYVPLDPENPAERLGFLVADAGTAVLLTHETWLSVLPARLSGGILCLDREVGALAAEEPAPVEGGVDPDLLAYVIYTSGTTGEPKGAMISHRSVVSYARALRRAVYGDDPRPLRVSLNARVAFDASVKQIAHLLWGHCLVVLPDAVRLDPRELLAFAREKRLDTLDCSPSQLKQLLEAGLLDPPGPGWVLIGGEAIEPATWDQLRAASGIRFFNHYGPTECTVNTTICRVAAAQPTLGGPIANVRVHLLDPAGARVPVGVPGEVHIAGGGVGRGYLRRPAQSAEKFVPDPFSPAPGGRLYRSGDLARYRPDGDLEFLGRIDHQVKVRGFRIELGEIEEVLARHPALRAAAVLDLEAENGERRLVACWVPAGEEAPPPSELRAFLKDRLPDYMLPGQWFRLSDLPLTANGKLDRRALARLARERGAEGDGRPHTAPRTATEEIVAGLWAELLGRERIGADDDFFELGGHSLLVTQVASRLRQTFAVEIELRVLFERSRLADLAQAVDERLADRASLAAPPITPVPRDRPLPLSFAQQRLWFVHQLEPESWAYIMSPTVRLHGKLDVAVLARVIGEIVRRHEVLRTTFPVERNEPVQRIGPAAAVPLPVVDVGALPLGCREKEGERLAVECAHQPFRLERDPVLRIRLVRLGDQDHILLFALHHIAFDGWSTPILLSEVEALYGAFSAGQPSPLAELPVQYADFSVWQRAWLEGPVLERQTSFWRHQLAGTSGVLELPTDRPRPAHASFAGASASRRMSGSLGERVEALSRRWSVTLFMTLLAGWKALLLRYTGQTDIVVGSPIANRNRAETERLIGFFVNTLALRTDLSDDPEFAALLPRVREVALGAYTHQDLPFEGLVKELNLDRDLSRYPLVQAVLVVQGGAQAKFELPGLAVSGLELDEETARFDLTLHVGSDEHGLNARLNYRTDIFDGATIERMLGHLERLMTAAAVTPEKRLSELPLLSAAEVRELEAWNGTAVVFPSGPCFHDLFFAQAERTPEAPALVYGDTELSYADLARRARQLARRLRLLGAGPGTVVGVCLERSLDLVVAILGAFAAGAAYVPLDPELPAERLAFLIADAGAELLLTHEAFLSVLPAWRNGALLRLDREAAALAAEDPRPLPGRVDPELPAYVIYTSGTTGEPKGAILQHRSLANYAHALRAAVYEDESRALRVSLNARVAFDASLKQLSHLLWGHCLVILPEAVRRDPVEMLRFARRERLDTLDCAPSQLRLLLPAGLLEAPGPSRVLVGGEAIEQALWDQLRASERVRFFNHYGPTECTVNTTICRIAGDRPVLGHPIANLRVHLLDRAGGQVPVGIPGEIHIAGEGVGLGYLRRPALTAERFVPDPFSASPGGRLYRSGDLARYRPLGELEFLGRSDHQVKIRGFRIELGEIEVVLLRHPGVQAAVVLDVEDESDRRLVACWVPAAGEAPSHSELRSHLRQRLPDYMLPAQWVRLGALPLNANGKLDRRALARAARERGGENDGLPHVAPRTPTAEILAGIWAELLGREQIGADDEFFELGGHSLLVTQVASRLRQAFAVEIDLRELFERSRLSELAEAVDARLADSAGIAVPPIPRAPRDRPLPLSFAQQRLWFVNRLAPESPAYNIPRALSLKGRLDPAALEGSLGEVVRRHEALRTTFPEAGREPVQAIAPALPVPLPRVDLRRLPAELREGELLRLVAAEAVRPFDLARGPLLRAALVDSGELEHVALFTLHHIVSDGWSTGVLIDELTAAYSAAIRGERPELPELPVQYADFAVWQRGWLSGEMLEGQLAHWRERLSGAPGELSLPTDFPRSARTGRRGAALHLDLPAPVASGLRAVSRRHEATLFMTLLGLFQVLLSHYSGQTDIVVGTPIAGRTRPEIEGLIGFFVNTLALRTDLSGCANLGDVLVRARETALAAYSHQDLPFERLLEELAIERDPDRHPLFQVEISLDNRSSQLALGDLSIADLPTGTGASKFDLSFTWVDSGDSLGGILAYDPDLFTAATVGGWLDAFGLLAETAAAHPDLGMDELHQLLARRDEENRLAAEARLEEASLLRLKRPRRALLRAGAESGGAE